MISQCSASVVDGFPFIQQPLGTCWKPATACPLASFWPWDHHCGRGPPPWASAHGILHSLHSCIHVHRGPEARTLILLQQGPREQPRGQLPAEQEKGRRGAEAKALLQDCQRWARNPEWEAVQGAG